MTKEQKFYDALKQVFIGAKVEGESGYINLMRIKSRYYEKGVFPQLQKDIEQALKPFRGFRDELFDKLYTFFSRYFSESGSIYFRYTPLHQNVYEKVYTDDKDVMLFYKTHMLYYVKTDRLFKNLDVEVEGVRFFFDASTLAHKKANEKREIVYEFKARRGDGVLAFTVVYSEKGRRTKMDDILKTFRKQGVHVSEEVLEQAFRVFERQSEVDYFINKNAKAFLEEQFNIWLYQYVFSGESQWTAERVRELQALKDIAFKVIAFISQFEDELVRVWNKPKFVLDANYVITLDMIAEKDMTLAERLFKHEELKDQVAEWQQLGMVDERFEVEDLFECENTSWQKGGQITLDEQWLKSRGLITTGYHLPYNPKLKDRTRDLRKNPTEAEKKLWYGYLRNFKYRVLRQRPIDNYIVDFYCPELRLVIEVDGESHFTEEGKVYDEERTGILNAYGLQVVRFTNEEVLRHFEAVCEKIPPAPLKKGGESPPSPLKKGGDKSFRSPLMKGGIEGGIAERYRYLPVDTRHFKDLELDILGLFENLDDALDGWLIRSENYQALNTALPKFSHKVQGIYIDPPYNADATEILYQNKFKHSSWLAMMRDRLEQSKGFLTPEGILCVTIDDNEQNRLQLLLEDVFGVENYLSTIAIRNNPSGRSTVKGFAINHEYGLFFAASADDARVGRLPHTEEQKKRYDQITDEGERHFEWENFRKNSTGSYRPDRPRQFYPIYYDKNTKAIRIPKMEWQEADKSWAIQEQPHESEVAIWPYDYSGQERVWRWGFERTLKSLGEILVKQKEDQFEIYKRKYLQEKGSLPRTWWDNPAYSARDNGTRILVDLFGSEKGFDFPKATRSVEDSLRVCSVEDEDIILDFFAGSGTTAHAVINLNRQDGGRRKYILVEMGEHFETVILPRIKKVVFCSEWKNGKPAGGKGISHFVKYYALEQYEDALRKARYEDSDLFDDPNQDPYHQYVFLRDLKMLEALKVDKKQNRVKVDLSRLYPDIDIAETLSNLTGKWIKRITADQVEFEDGETMDLQNLDWKRIKPLIWW